MASAGAARLTELLTPVVSAAGHDLEDLTVSPAGRRRVVRVLVDRDGGTSLDDVAELSRTLSDALDDIDAREPALLGGAYVLEVSSPGVDRPLLAPRHWRRNIGRLVAATLADGQLVTGRLTRVDGDDGAATVELAGRSLLLAEVVRGTVQVEFARPDQAGPEDAADPEADDAADPEAHDAADDDAADAAVDAADR